MKTYYETTHNDGGEFPVTTAHATLEEAIEFAEANGIDLICEIGGAYDEYEKCGFCDEWMPSQDLDENGWCEHCNWYTKHGRA